MAGPPDPAADPGIADSLQAIVGWLGGIIGGLRGIDGKLCGIIGSWCRGANVQALPQPHTPLPHIAIFGAAVGAGVFRKGVFGAIFEAVFGAGIFGAGPYPTRHCPHIPGFAAAPRLAVPRC